jgi:ribose 5-phosphate isomerase B
MPTETIAIASDHAGLELKQVLAKDLADLGYGVLDLGTDGPASVDYPDFADAMARAFDKGEVKRGVLICGSGLGITMAANRHRHLRAAPCHDHLSARLARAHNNANVLGLGARLIGVDTARDCLRIFLATDFEGGRHERRVAKMS